MWPSITWNDLVEGSLILLRLDHHNWPEIWWSLRFKMINDESVAIPVWDANLSLSISSRKKKLCPAGLFGARRKGAGLMPGSEKRSQLIPHWRTGFVQCLKGKCRLNARPTRFWWCWSGLGLDFWILFAAFMLTQNGRWYTLNCYSRLVLFEERGHRSQVIGLRVGKFLGKV